MPAPSPKSEAAALIDAASIRSEAFDADAFFAEFEAQAKPFTFRGERFDLPAPETWPDSLDEAKTLLDVSTAILGEEQAVRFREVGGSIKFLQALIKKLHGLTVGESGASSSS